MHYKFYQCVSMNNQACIVRPEIVNINSNNPIFYPFSVKINKCSGNCNNINDPYARIWVPDIIRNLTVKIFNLMTITNETRSIKCHETCKCICRLNKIICNNKQRWNKDKYRCECKELIDKGFIWNPSNCGCECANACNTVNIQVIQIVSVKKEIDPLIEECTENDDDETNMVNKTITKYGDETKLVNKTMTKNENSYCNSCKV